jgi:hypothetical protein
MPRAARKPEGGGEPFVAPWPPGEMLAWLAEDMANRRRAQLTDAGDPRCTACGTPTLRDGMHNCPRCDGAEAPIPVLEPTPEPEPAKPSNVISLADRVKRRHQ